MRTKRSLTLIAALTTTSLFGELIARAYPSDVFTTPSAVPTPQAGKETNPSFASDRVDESGAATISIPIPTAPNRNGHVPNLALGYSSKNAARGGLAMGWTLDLPSIEVDTARGAMQEIRYRASGGGRLIQVDEPVEAGWTAWRGEEDGSFTRFERKDGELASQWRARQTDGTVLYFGETDESKDLNNEVSAWEGREGRWFVTRSVDKYGNEIRYNYEKVMGYAPEGQLVPVDIAISSIEYGANAAAGLTHHTVIRFDYAAPDHCDVGNVPVGALMDYRTGLLMYKGAARLTSVHLETRGASGMTERRRLDLSYDTNELQCHVGSAHAPLRILTGVTETGFAADGTATVMPTRTFQYNRLERMFDATRNGVSAGPSGEIGEPTPGGPKNRDATHQLTIDLDGDGRLDRVSTGALGAGGHCTAVWERGVAGGFEPAAEVGDDQTFLTLPWRTGSAPTGRELCSLSHQLTSFDNTPGSSTCSIEQAESNSPDAQMKYNLRDWNHDGLPDLVMTAEGRGDVYRAELDSTLGPDPSCNPPVPGPGQCVRVEEAACGGFVTRVRFNQGDGTFSAPESFVLPRPLDPEQGANGATWDSYVDFDGDGWEDVVSYVRNVSARYNAYNVRLNQRDGTFSAPITVQLPDIDGYEWDTTGENEVYRMLALAPSVGRNIVGWESVPLPGDQDSELAETGSTNRTAGELRDVNGDGLVDYVFSHGTGARVLYNRGGDFSMYLGVANQDRGHLLLGPNEPEMLEESMKINEVDKQESQYNVGIPVQGDRWFSRSTLRAIDFDDDGLVDLVKLPEPQQVRSVESGLWFQYQPEIGENEHAELFLNLGDRFVSVGNSVPLERAKQALSHRIVNGTGFQLQQWRTESDFVDADGDGLPEAIDGSAIGHARYDSDDQPLRTLKSASDGRGGHTDYHYRAVVGEGAPHVVWVVDQVTTRADVGAEGADPAMVTSYDYEGAVYNADPEGDYGFRGFTRTTVSLPSGAYQVVTKDYAQSYHGLVTREEIFAADGNLASYTSRSFETRTLFANDAFPGEVTTYHPTLEQTRTCRAGQGYMQCLGSGDRRVTERSFVALAPLNGGVPARQVQQWERTGAVPGAVTGNKLSWNVPQYTSSATTYLDHPAGEVKFVYDAPNLTRQVSAIWHYYDTSKRCEFWTTRNIDSSGNYAVSTHICDLATGNVFWEVSPRHFSANSPGRVIQYDADQRFVAQVTNELGHTTVKTWDPATGKQLSERGPNTKAAQGILTRDGWEVDVDGFGRELRRRVYLDDAVSGYRAEEISRASYFDQASQPSRVVIEKKIDLGGSRWAKTEAISDALGRPIIERTYENGSVRAETRRFYDAAGQQSRVKVPRPGAYNLEFVEWQYAYDSLGRMLEAREPSHPGCDGALGTAGACGKRWTYSGRTTTELDAVGTAGGKIGKSRSTLDAFGRLVKVEELLDDGSWATTNYELDGNDNVARVVSADGVVTVMEHDQLSRRTAVTRGANTWRFGYDANGNLTSVTSPLPAGAQQADYTTTLAYDPLNRETLRLPAKRDWTKAELDDRGSGAVTTTYDVGANGIGRVASVEADWGNPDRYRVDYTYEARGLVSSETHRFSVLGGTYADTRTLTRTYTAQGLSSSSTEADGDLPSTSTKLVTTYDTRGLPAVLYWWGYGWTQQVRRLADGRVFHRYWSHPGVLEAEGNTAFDDVGRVVWLNVKSKLPGETTATQRVAQGYHFDGAGDVYQLDTIYAPTGGVGQDAYAQYAYDTMHRLVAATGDRGYKGTFAYSPGGRIIAANVSADASAVRVQDRDVTYVYGSDVPGSTSDPDAPLRLVENGGGADFMSIDYDRAGNATSRALRAGTYNHVYDGLDRQREVTNPDGSKELDFYGADGMRALVVTVDPNDDVQRVQWNLGGTEIWYDGDGHVEKTVATSAIDGAVVRVVDRDHRELVFQDPRSHVIATIGENGELLSSFSYGPYGELLREHGSEPEEHLRRFNGKQWDETTGLSYYGYRYYDEASLTWTQADPKFRWSVDLAWRRPRAAQVYAFAEGNPVSLVDPDGRQPNRTFWQKVWDKAISIAIKTKIVLNDGSVDSSRNANPGEPEPAEVAKEDAEDVQGAKEKEERTKPSEFSGPRLLQLPPVGGGQPALPSAAPCPNACHTPTGRLPSAGIGGPVSTKPMSDKQKAAIVMATVVVAVPVAGEAGAGLVPETVAEAAPLVIKSSPVFWFWQFAH
ncbi:MAG: RHS repeat-associated core domain-containing protein [Polyangiaceae bacterium]